MAQVDPQSRACTVAGRKARPRHRTFITSILLSTLAPTIALTGKRPLVQTPTPILIGSDGSVLFATSQPMHHSSRIFRPAFAIYNWQKLVTAASRKKDGFCLMRRQTNY